jgi:hypothetical protein
MTRRTARHLAALVFVVTFTSSAAADQCATLAPKWRFKRADAVFLGTVVEASGGYAAFRVDEAFKGTEEGLLVYTAPLGSFSFEVMFEPGKSYLVYGHQTASAQTPIALPRVRRGVCRRTLASWSSSGVVIHGG